MTTFNYEEAKNKDLELYTAWKDNPTKSNMGALLKQLQPMIHREVSRLTGSVPTPALKMEATKWAIEGIKTFDPSHGAALSTHVANWLQKTKRLNYKVQNAARLAENQQLRFNQYNTARQDLMSELSREPTHEELAARITSQGKDTWTAKQVKKFQNELFNDFSESGAEYAPTFKEFDSGKIQWSYVMDNLTPDEKKLLDLLMKAEDTKMSAEQTAKELGVNINRYNYLRRKLVDRMAELKKEIGEF